MELKERVAEVQRKGQPPSVMKVNPKTGELLMALNVGSYNTQLPRDVTLLYDIFTAIFRLFAEKEWIPFIQICDNVMNTEYISEWQLFIFDHIQFGVKMDLLVIRGDNVITEGSGQSNIEIRLVRNRKTNLVKQVITTFDRSENINNWTL